MDIVEMVTADIWKHAIPAVKTAGLVLAYAVMGHVVVMRHAIHAVRIVDSVVTVAMPAVIMERRVNPVARIVECARTVEMVNAITVKPAIPVA